VYTKHQKLKQASKQAPQAKHGSLVGQKTCTKLLLPTPPHLWRLPETLEIVGLVAIFRLYPSFFGCWWALFGNRAAGK